MKLRDFVANSLPRVRGRKKKGQTGSGAPASITAAVAAAAVATGPCSFPVSQPNSPDVLNPRSSRQDGNGNWFSFSSESRFGFFEKLVGKDSPVKRLLENKDRRAGSAPTVEKRHEEDTSGYSPRFCPSSATEPSSPYGRGGGIRSPPLGEKPVFHSQHASPVSVCWAGRDRYSDWDCSSLYTSRYGYPESLTSFESTPGSQRGPRSRSRIRTNPWLPSPRPSPYSVRSLSSPCTSSRSPSPSSSPAPPSSSDNSTSPLTSFSSDVSATHEAQLLRHRRHRRHHSEVKASDLTRHIVFDPPLTDTEQYYSTLDSGIGDSAVSSGEKDKHKLATSRKHRNLNSKRRSVERDSDPGKTIASSSPKSKPRYRTKNRSSRPSSTSSGKGLIANRDSKFWDSDSSSRSPPRTSRSLGASQDVLYFDNWHSESCAVPGRCQQLPGIPREAVSSFLPGDFLYGPDSVDFGPVSGSHSVLSPCDDICIITSNIEQLAQNISSEYEEGLDVSFESMLDCSKQDQKRDSLSDLYNLDSDAARIPCKLESVLCSALDYSSFAEPLQCRELRREEEEESLETLESNTSRNTPQPDTDTPDDTSTVDVAVQTDFADDDDEDVSGSDWLASTESGSDWVTSNGSGSDWPNSGGSDWPTAEGSGCATEEEEEGGKEGEEEESTLWVEGSRLWFVPDIMHNSTDTGYSSLSRDGRIVTDDNNNTNNNNNNNNNNNDNSVTNAEDSSDSSSATTTTTTTTDEKMSKTSDSDVAKSDTPGNTPPKSDIVASGAIPKTGARQILSTRVPLAEDFDSCGGSCAQRVSCKLEFNILGGSCKCSGNALENETALLPSGSNDQSDYGADDVDFSVKRNRQEGSQPKLHHASRVNLERRNSNYDHVVPYPYDVRRFSDVILPFDEREGSVSPCLHDSVPSRSGEAGLEETPSKLKLALFTSSPRHHRSEGDDDFYPCFLPVTSDHHDGAQSNPEDCFEYHRSSDLAVPAPLLRRSLPLRSCDDLPCTGRPLQEVRASLEDKVHVLRQGRRLVSKKIREAREEEMVRQQQKLRFQRLLDIHRKRILLGTLQDLRQRLESQSARLQASYSAVLNLQKRCA